MRKSVGLLVANVMGYIAMLVVNGLANAIPIGGRTTGEISEYYPSYFTPAGFTFGIWGLIYVGLGLFVGWQVFEFLRERRLSRETKAIGWLFFFTCILNSTWIVAWHYLLIPLSLLIMFMLLCTLGLIYRKVHFLTQQPPVKPVYQMPFSLYTGWITAAFLANVTVFLIHLGFDAQSVLGVLWASFLVLIALTAGMAGLVAARDPVYAGVIFWTLGGIIAARIPDGRMAYPVIAIAGIGMAMLAFSFVRMQAAGRGGKGGEGA